MLAVMMTYDDRETEIRTGPYFLNPVFWGGMSIHLPFFFDLFGASLHFMLDMPGSRPELPARWWLGNVEASTRRRPSRAFHASHATSVGVCDRLRSSQALRLNCIWLFYGLCFAMWRQDDST